MDTIDNLRVSSKVMSISIKQNIFKVFAFFALVLIPAVILDFDFKKFVVWWGIYIIVLNIGMSVSTWISKGLIDIVIKENE